MFEVVLIAYTRFTNLMGVVIYIVRMALRTDNLELEIQTGTKREDF
jgi:hypothetical protein